MHDRKSVAPSWALRPTAFSRSLMQATDFSSDDVVARMEEYLANVSAAMRLDSWCSKLPSTAAPSSTSWTEAHACKANFCSADEHTAANHIHHARLRTDIDGISRAALDQVRVYIMIPRMLCSYNFLVSICRAQRSHRLHQALRVPRCQPPAEQHGTSYESGGRLSRNVREAFR